MQGLDGLAQLQVRVRAKVGSGSRLGLGLGIGLGLGLDTLVLHPDELATAALRIERRIDNSFDDRQLAVAGQHCEELAELLLFGRQAGESPHNIGDRDAGVTLEGTAVVCDRDFPEVREVQHRSPLLGGEVAGVAAVLDDERVLGELGR